MKGIAINSFDLKGKSYPLIWGGDAANYTFGYGADDGRICSSSPGAMNLEEVEGKIVICEGIQDGSTVLLANGVGTIIVNTEGISTDYAFSFPLPVTFISTDDAEKVMDYVKSTK